MPAYLSYRAEGDALWKTVLARSKTPTNQFTIHTVELISLEPDTRYEFRIDDSPKSEIFRTLTADTHTPIRFIVGGDAYHSLGLLKKTARTAAQLAPQFVIIGGDVAYALRKVSFFKTMGWEERRWHAFFEEWSKIMITPTGERIPLLLVAGNHDVKGPPSDDLSPSTLFYDYYPLKNPMRTYRVLDLNPTLSLYFLDTGHGEPIEGKQTEWLKSSLAKRTSVPFKVAVYHKAAYPSYYSYDSDLSKKIRKHWTPLFDDYNLKIAFENDNHTYKRTHPIKNGEIDPFGTLYLGDGAWGVDPRHAKKPEDLWYLAQSGSVNHFYLVESRPEGLKITSFDSKGRKMETISASSNI